MQNKSDKRENYRIMKNLEKQYIASLKEARNLPTHIGDELQEHYKFNGKVDPG